MGAAGAPVLKQRPRRATSNLGRDSRNSVLVDRRSADESDIPQGSSDDAAVSLEAVAAAVATEDARIDAAVAATAAAFGGRPTPLRLYLLTDFTKT